jgi:hypothetical protein
MYRKLPPVVTEEETMVDPPETDEPPVADTTVGPPRWVKVFAALALLVLLLFIVLLVTGRGGDHGPGRHGSSGGSRTVGEHAPPAGVTHGEQQR